MCGGVVKHTRNYIASIHRILVLDETKAVHELDLGDLAGAMSVEVGFNISFGCCVSVSIWDRDSMENLSELDVSKLERGRGE